MSNHWSPATHVARPRGSTVRTDEEGSYVAYHRVCNNCNVELTSRNRLSDRRLNPAIGYVSAGVVEIMAKQQQGWSYVLP
jgi:intracellular sulfur oxidation DsrE/DsrF family protein